MGKKNVFGFGSLKALYDNQSNGYFLHLNRDHAVDLYLSKHDEKNKHIIYYLDKDGSALAFITTESHGEDISLQEKISRYNVEYIVKYVYISATSWSEIHIPDTVEDMIVDWRFVEENRYPEGGFFSHCPSCFEVEGSKWDDYQIVCNSDKTRLIFCKLKKSGMGINLPETITEIDDYAFALRGGYCQKLTIPSNIKAFDLERFSKNNYVKEIVFKGEVSKLTCPKGDFKSTVRINNTIDRVNADIDVQMKSNYIFQPSINGMAKPGEVTLTLAGAEVVPGRHGFRYIPCQKWAQPITINTKFIAYTTPVVLDCYEQHEGTEIMLLGEGLENTINREMMPVVRVYEDMQTVSKLLEEASRK